MIFIRQRFVGTASTLTKVRFKMRGTNCKIKCFFFIPTKTMILHLESVRKVRNFISSPTLVKKLRFFGEKMKNEKLGYIEKHVQMRES